MKVRLLCLLIAGAFIQIVNAQIEWAERLVSFSSQRGNMSYSAKQVLGPPSKLPALGDCGCAWAPKLPDNNQEEFVRVKFGRKMTIRRVFVSENHNAGSVCKIYVYDKYNREHLVYSQEGPDATYGRMKVIDVKELPFETDELRLVLNTEWLNGYNQIDAIGVSDSRSVNFTMPEINESDYFEFIGIAENVATINSPGSDIAPILSDDGKRLYFTRKDHPRNIGDVMNDDIWYADIKGVHVQTAINPGSPINNSNNNYVIGVSRQGKFLSLANMYQPDGSSAMGVAQTWQYNNSWRFPMNLVTPGLITYNLYAEYYMNPDRSVLLVSLEKASGQGLKDIYVCFSGDQMQWSLPQSLGPVINTPGNEMAPSLSPDGKYLFFASDGMPGYGEQDIYVSERLDDTWTNWSTPANLGPLVNSDGFDAYFTYNDSSAYAYFTSTRDSYFNPDIYRIQIAMVEEEPEEEFAEEPSATQTVTSTETEPVEPEPAVNVLPDGTLLTDDLLLFGTIYDAVSGYPVDALLLFELAGYDSPVDSLETLNRNYRKKITDNVRYKVVVLKEGYLYYEDQVEIAEMNEQKVKRVDFRITPARSGEKFRIDNLSFRANSYIIKSESWPDLNKLAAFLLKNPTLKVEIGGHTNGLCDDEFCNKLSLQRADAVKEYLVKKGVPPDSVETKGYGKTDPVASDDTPEGRNANQRVEVTIL